MLREERQRRIRQAVNARGQTTVADLARQFEVTEMTIRRDLDELAGRGLLQRTHGGAVALAGSYGPPDAPVLERAANEWPAKQRIAQAVAGMIADGERIFLGSGTTTLAVAEALMGRADLTVVTNALTVANTLAAMPGIRVTVVGGSLRPSELSLIGHHAETMLREIRVNKVIMGVKGIDPEYGFTSDHYQELMTDRAIMGTSDMVIVVADHTKFRHIAASRMAPLTAARMLVTDTAAPGDLVAVIRALGVRVVLV